MLYSVFLCTSWVQRHHFLLTSPFADQIKRLQKNSSIDHEFSVIWVPRRTLVCNKILEEAGVLGDVSVEALSLYFIPLEHDVLTLALEESFGDLLIVCFLRLLDTEVPF